METDGVCRKSKGGLEEVSDLLFRVMQGDHYIKPYGIIKTCFLG